jgi:hypothetical protein
VAAAAIALPSTCNVLRDLPHFEHFVATVYLPNPLFALPIAYQNYSLAQEHFAQLLQFDLMQVT